MKSGSSRLRTLAGVERSTVLATPRLELTTWAHTDLGDLHELHSDPETMRHIRNGRPESRAQCANVLAGYLAEQANGWTKWRLTDATGQMVGRAGFGRHLGFHTLAYTIRRDRWGEGLATEIGGALVSWHRENSDDHRTLIAYVAIANRASAKVLVKLGFVATEQQLHHGALCDVFSRPAGERQTDESEPVVGQIHQRVIGGLDDLATGG